MKPTPNYNDILSKFQKWLIHQRCCVVSYKSGLQVCDSNCWNVFESMFSQALTLATERAVKEENKAWVEGRRCYECGKEDTPSPLSNTCQECFENN